MAEKLHESEDVALVGQLGEHLRAEMRPGDRVILLYSEVDDGVISADLFMGAESGDLSFKFASEECRHLVQRLWRSSRPEKGRWSSVSFLVRRAGVFVADFDYPDGHDNQDDPIKRRSMIVARYFGDRAVKYS